MWRGLCAFLISSSICRVFRSFSLTSVRSRGAISGSRIMLYSSIISVVSSRRKQVSHSRLFE